MILSKIFRLCECDSLERTQERINAFLTEEWVEYVDSCIAGTKDEGQYADYLLIVFYRKKA